MKTIHLRIPAISIAIIGLCTTMSAYACDEEESDYVDEFFVSSAAPVNLNDPAGLSMLAASQEEPQVYSN